MPRPAAVLSITLLLVRLLVSTVAASLALDAGEAPVTVLPFGRALAAFGLPALVVALIGSVAALWTVTVRVAPRFRYLVLSVTGSFWPLWGVWQIWLSLART